LVGGGGIIMGELASTPGPLVGGGGI
jgi:hypothetical protein